MGSFAEFERKIAKSGQRERVESCYFLIMGNSKVLTRGLRTTHEGRSSTLLPLGFKAIELYCQKNYTKVYNLRVINYRTIVVIWNVEYTDEFELWWNSLTEGTQIDVASTVNLLEQCGPNLKFPFSSGIEGSKLTHLRELRIQHTGEPYRVLYAFDPRRCVILLLGDNKTGDDRWYEKNIPIAERLYQQHLSILKAEEKSHD